MPAAAPVRRNRRLVAVALAALTAPMLVVGGSSPSAFAATDAQKLSQLQQESSSAATDIGVTDAAAQKAALALARINNQVSGAKHTLALANDTLHKAQVRLNKLRTVLAKAQTEEKNAQAQVDVATNRYNAARDQIRVMLRAAYEEGVGGDLDALMSGGTPDELANRVGLLDELSAARQRRLTTLGASRDALTRIENLLTASRTKAQKAVAAADQQVGTVSNAQGQAQDAAAQLVSLQKNQQNAVLGAKNAAAAARQKYSALQAASARLQNVLAARAAAQRSASGYPLSTGGDPGVQSAGGLVMPTTGVFSSGFGYRIDPFGGGTSFHAGQDIAAPTGTPIVAATAGTVAIVETPDQSGGYGNYTCIDRGAGFATCYAHQSVVMVHVGQVVAQGQLIGLVGSTGASTGPHLHFEVRLNGVPVNPLPYLP